MAHYRNNHVKLADSVLNCSYTDEKRKIMEKAISSNASARNLINRFSQLAAKNVAIRAVSQDLRRRVSGVLLAASKQIPLDLFSSPEFEAFISCTGGTSEKSKYGSIKI